MELKGQSVIVIGGSSGIGLAIAQASAREGANVTIVSRSTEKLDSAKETIIGKVQSVSLDVNDEDAVDNFFSRLQNIDHIVMTAGSPKFRGLSDMKLADAKIDFDNFFWRAFVVAKYGIPKLKETGSILFTSGIIAAKPFKGGPVLCAALNAVEGFAKALAVDYAPVRVNVLCPGFTRTPLAGDNPEKKFAARIEKMLIKRIAEPEEMAKTAFYLMTNKYVTGQIMRVEGGLLLG